MSLTSSIYILLGRVNARPKANMILLMVIDAKINNHQDPKTPGKSLKWSNNFLDFLSMDQNFTGDFESWFGFFFSCFEMCSVFMNVKRVVNLFLQESSNLKRQGKGKHDKITTPQETNKLSSPLLSFKGPFIKLLRIPLLRHLSDQNLTVEPFPITQHKPRPVKLCQPSSCPCRLNH